jgi:hypothetical protein
MDGQRRHRSEPHVAVLRRHWGAARKHKLAGRIGRAEIVHSGPELVVTEVRLRVSCERAGHALGQSEHTADRWIVAAALRLWACQRSLTTESSPTLPGVTRHRVREATIRPKANSKQGGARSDE